VRSPLAPYPRFARFAPPPPPPLQCVNALDLTSTAPLLCRFGYVGSNQRAMVSISTANFTNLMNGASDAMPQIATVFS
jgi:hypothetical protein